MLRKLFASGLLLVLAFGLLLGGRVSSQDKLDLEKDGKRVFPLKPDTTDANLDQLVQELKNVRVQKMELERRERQLMEAIENRINTERQRLDQKVQERLRQLDEIERLIIGDVKDKRMKGVPKEDLKK